MQGDNLPFFLAHVKTTKQNPTKPTNDSPFLYDFLCTPTQFRRYLSRATYSPTRTRAGRSRPPDDRQACYPGLHSPRTRQTQWPHSTNLQHPARSRHLANSQDNIVLRWIPQKCALLTGMRLWIGKMRMLV